MTPKTEGRFSAVVGGGMTGSHMVVDTATGRWFAVEDFEELCELVAVINVATTQGPQVSEDRRSDRDGADAKSNKSPKSEPKSTNQINTRRGGA